MKVRNMIHKGRLHGKKTMVVYIVSNALQHDCQAYNNNWK